MKIGVEVEMTTSVNRAIDVSVECDTGMDSYAEKG